MEVCRDVTTRCAYFAGFNRVAHTFVTAKPSSPSKNEQNGLGLHTRSSVSLTKSLIYIFPYCTWETIKHTLQSVFNFQSFYVERQKKTTQSGQTTTFPTNTLHSVCCVRIASGMCVCGKYSCFPFWHKQNFALSLRCTLSVKSRHLASFLIDCPLPNPCRSLNEI